MNTYRIEQCEEKIAKMNELIAYVTESDKELFTRKDLDYVCNAYDFSVPKNIEPDKKEKFVVETCYCDYVGVRYYYLKNTIINMALNIIKERKDTIKSILRDAEYEIKSINSQIEDLKNRKLNIYAYLDKYGK